MEIAHSSAIERIARVLAGRRISANAEGDAESAGQLIDTQWTNHVDDAVAILKSLREPDEAMAKAGDPAIWEAMVRAALNEPG